MTAQAINLSLIWSTLRLHGTYLKFVCMCVHVYIICVCVYVLYVCLGGGRTLTSIDIKTLSA